MGVPSDRQLEVCRRHGLEPRAPEPMLALALRTLGDSPLHGSRIELLPEVLDYLYLPPGARFIIDGDGYEDVWLEPASA
ncbi:hypothetical protein [Pseudomonas paraeruginosa]|uniref:immunity protein Imm33 domain-containing protein n=1 Tax=Pseudomonas paraeruginosa TaxID=2994495 RepID=UPI003A4C5F53